MSIFTGSFFFGFGVTFLCSYFVYAFHCLKLFSFFHMIIYEFLRYVTSNLKLALNHLFKPAKFRAICCLDIDIGYMYI